MHETHASSRRLWVLRCKVPPRVLCHSWAVGRSGGRRQSRPRPSLPLPAGGCKTHFKSGCVACSLLFLTGMMLPRARPARAHHVEPRRARRQCCQRTRKATAAAAQTASAPPPSQSAPRAGPPVSPPPLAVRGSSPQRDHAAALRVSHGSSLRRITFTVLSWSFKQVLIPLA